MSELQRALRRTQRDLDQTQVKEQRGGAGASFPTGISAGFRFFRTDLGFDCYYDGTRWLTIHEYHVPITMFGDQTAAANGNFTGPELRSDYAPYITRIVTGYHVATTNNGANFWTILLRAYNVAYSAATGIDQFDTSGVAANTWLQDDTATFSGTGTPANRARFDLSVTVFGAPGVITVNQVVSYRLIIT